MRVCKYVCAAFSLQCPTPTSGETFNSIDLKTKKSPPQKKKKEERKKKELNQKYTHFKKEKKIKSTQK